jgi:glycosyltransferase involved in cell wall biosynthesis
MTGAAVISHRLPRVLAIAEGVIPSVELAANIPFARLQEQGHCEYRFRLAGETAFSDLRWCDTLFVVRGASCRTGLLVKEARRHKRFVVSYWDDNPFCIPESSSSHAYFADPRVRATLSGILEDSDQVVSPTKALAESLARKTGRPVSVLGVPSFSPVDRLPERVGGEEVVIGFAGSTDHLATIQELIIPALEVLVQRGMAFRFEVVGPEPAVPASLQGRVRHIPYFAQYADWISFRNGVGWDMAVAPLPDREFYACKYHNKFVEMSSAGLPCIFSNVPTYSGVVRHMENGILAENTPKAWADAIELLGRSHSLRRQLARTAWTEVRQSNAPEAVGQSYASALHAALQHRAPALSGVEGAMGALGVRGLALWVRLAMDAGPEKAAQRVRQPLRKWRNALHSFLAENPHG